MVLFRRFDRNSFIRTISGSGKNSHVIVCTLQLEPKQQPLVLLYVLCTRILINRLLNFLFTTFFPHKVVSDTVIRC